MAINLSYNKFLPVKIFFACALSLGFSRCLAESPEVTVVYLDRYPFSYSLDGTTAGAPAGLLVEYAAQIFQQAGIDVTFVMQPSARIIRPIAENQNPYCALAYIKNAEREQFAHFSLPFYREEPMVLVALKKNAARLESHKTIVSIFKDKSLVLGEGSDKSYGYFIDIQKTTLKPQIFKAQASINVFLKMLEAGRFDYVLTVPSEVRALMVRSHIDPANYLFMPLADVSEVNYRYFMCNKKVGADIIQRLNAELIKTPLPPSELNPMPLTADELAALLPAN